MHGIFLSFHLPLTFALFSGEILVHNDTFNSLSVQFVVLMLYTLPAGYM